VKTLPILLLLVASSLAIAQDIVPVPRPQPIGYAPSRNATTVSVKWFFYAEYLEKLIAQKDAEIAQLRSAPPDPTIATKLSSIEGKVDEIVAIKPAIAAIIVPGYTTVQVGTVFSLQARHDGSPGGVTYQWYRNGVKLEGRTESKLQFAAATFDDAAVYRVTVQSSVRTIECIFTLTVIPPIP
jgi:hypothetical protein